MGFRKLIPVLFILLILLAAFLLYDSYSRLVVTEYELRYANLPDSFDGYRITVLSDIHAAVFGENNAALISKIIETDPDIIAVIGDFIDRDENLTTDEQIAIAEALVTAISPVSPIYYVTGNHEWDSGAIKPFLEMLRERGVNVLRNQYALLERGVDSIILAGTDDPNGPADMIKPDEFVMQVFKAEGGRFMVMLEHRNNHLRLYSELGVDLVLSGHAHGGIIRLPFTDGLIGPTREWLPTYTNGVYAMGGTNMVVSRGIGNHTGWPRFLNNPQIVVVVLRSEE